MNADDMSEDEMRRRLQEAEDTIRALRSGEADALLVHAGRDQVYTLETVDKPYRLMVEQMPQAAATLTVEGAILHCNRAFADLLGRTPDALIGRSLHEFIAAEGRARFDALPHCEQGADIRDEFTMLRADGEGVPVYLGVCALSEGALGECLLVTDLTERRHYEELQDAQAALRDADRRKDEFLATLAHELRSPLAPIRNAVQILKDRGQPDPRLDWAQGVIDRQVSLMARLLDDLLDVSRISRHRLHLRKERVDLSSVLEAALETSRPAIEAKGHTFTIRLPAEPVCVHADPMRLAQVFFNLLNNAARYTEERGHIWLTAERRGEEAVVSVRDSGVGLAPEMLPRIFEIFSQATVNPAPEQAEGGLGIGLSLVKGLVELHGGRVEGRSEGLGRGSEFIVHLPAVGAPDVEPAFPQQRRSEPAATRHRILVVDDNRDSADTLAMLLRIRGHEVTISYEGEQAIELARSWRPRAVLLDLGMPRMSGYEVCRRIRAEDWGKDMILVALTGWGQEEDRRRTREAGFDHHSVKPVDLEELMSLLD